MKQTRFLVAALLVLILSNVAQAQSPQVTPPVTPPGTVAEIPYNIIDSGVVYEHEPSTFKINFHFRIQNRISFLDYDEDDAKNKDTLDFTVRRARVAFDGHLLDKRLLYKFQFGFSNGDLDVEANNYPNILRDAVLGWRLTPKSTIWFGQAKLPGNRQRVIGSGNLEFADRSLVSTYFNIDRDLGVQYWQTLGEERPVMIKAAVSNGEGRGVNNKSVSIAYTGRVEWLPLGTFKDNGDYFEGDLAFEKTPKLSFGATYSLNKNTTRVGGQIGKFLNGGEVRDIKTLLLDGLLKYQGWAFNTEYAARDADNPVIDTTQTVYKGKAVHAQLSYVFPNYYSPAIRWTKQIADKEILSVENDRTQYTIGLTKYFHKHRIKLQGDATYEQVKNPLLVRTYDNWFYRLQVEVGI
jgi:hypothetical protein